MPRKKAYRSYQPLPFTIGVAGGTIAENDVARTVPGQVMTEERRVLSVEQTIGMDDLTSGDGPIEVGVAHSDYSVAEIEEYLGATAAWDEGNLIAREQSNRLIRRIGIVSEQETMINDGKKMKTRLNWRIATGDTIQFWIRNLGDDLTTGMVMNFQGVLHSVLA